jgi:lantibiotic modifying enzyme
MQREHNRIRFLDLIEKEAESIGEFFVHRSEFVPSIGLYGGEAGTTLLMAQFYLKTRDGKYLSKLRENLDKMIHLCSESTDVLITPYFSNGLAGFGWLLCYLRENALVDFTDDYLSDLDDILQDQLKDIDSATYWDLLHGRLSIVRYFFKRKNTRVIETELKIMREQAIIIGEEYKWISKKRNGEVSYDMGLAHGMAGILYYVGKSYEMGVMKELCLELGNGILGFYHRIQQDFLQIGSFYPNIIPIETSLDNNREIKSRLGWCYGDLGILYSIYLYCLRTDRQTELDDVIEKLLLTANRKECSSNQIYDAMLCHGSAGLVQIYIHLYVLSGNKKFRDVAYYWLQVSMEIGREPLYNPPYKFAVSRDKETGEYIWSESLSLLEGVTGVGLAYLSILDYDHINWDEILMLH